MQTIQDRIDSKILAVVKDKRWCEFCTRYTIKGKDCEFLGKIKNTRIKPCSWFNRKEIPKLRRLKRIEKLLGGEK